MTLITLRLLEDEPIAHSAEDKLGLRPFAKIIAGAAVGTQGPFTIGVFADWGQGKTSLLRQAKSMIDDSPEHPHVLTVWFNAWQFEKEEHPIVPLIAAVVRQAQRHREQSLSEPLRRGLQSIGRALRAVAYGISAKAKIKVPGVGEVETGFVAREMIEHYEELGSSPDPLLDRSLYYDAFEVLRREVQGLRGGGRKDSEIPKIVVFIDDLDRCLPHQGLKVLEGIKLALSQPGFIFVLAMDRSLLQGYLTKRYRDEFGIEEYEEAGTSYLDKIIQLPFPLPPHEERFGNYIQGLLTLDVFRGSNESVRKALSQLLEILAIGSDYNPRNLVRLINNLIADRQILELQQKKAGPKTLGLYAVTRTLQRHLGDRLYGFLVSNDSLCHQLAAAGQDGDSQKGLLGLKTKLGESEKLALRVILRLEEARFLSKLIKSEAGRQWLEDHKKRRETNEFLTTQRSTLVGPAEEAYRAVVDEAIRHALRKFGGRVTRRDRETVQSLDLSFEGLADEALAALSDLKSLTRLDLESNAITDRGLENLKDLDRLEGLNLSDTEVSDAGLQHLARLRTLIWLDLTGTSLTGSGLRHLRPLEALDELDLGNTAVSGKELRHLEGLSLRMLDLSNTDVQSDELVHLARLTSLESLDLSGTNVASEGLEHLEGLPSLRKLDLTGTKVGDSGLPHLTHMGALRELILDEEQLSSQALDELRGALPECELIFT